MNPIRVALTFAAMMLISPGSAGQDATESASGELMQKCKYPTRPEIPNGRTATEEEMLSSQKALKAYLASGDGYLACVEQVKLGWGEATSDEQRAVIVIFHNRMVDEMQATADLYNQAVRAFKGKRGS